MMRFQTMLAMENPKFMILGAMPPNPAEWGIGGRVRLTYADWIALMAAHDENHLDQSRRALEGKA